MIFANQEIISVKYVDRLKELQQNIEGLISLWSVENQKKKFKPGDNFVKWERKM